MMRARCILCGFAALIVAGNAAGQTDSLVSLLPPGGEVQGWVRVGSVQVYAGQDLFRLIDGGAPLYFEYGFRRAAACQYRLDPAHEISVEIYDMDSTSGAYGIFSILAAGPHARSADLGDGGTEGSGYLAFWKGHTYVVLTSGDTSAASSGHLLGFARAIEGKIADHGTLPPLVEVLIEAIVECPHPVFVRGALGLNGQYRFGTGDIFGVREGAACAGSAKEKAFILAYPTARDCREHTRSASRQIRELPKYSGWKEDMGIASFRDEDGNRFHMGQLGRLLILTATREENRAFLNRVLAAAARLAPDP